MFKELHPNRWFIWTIAFLVSVAIILLGAIWNYNLEQDKEVQDLRGDVILGDKDATAGWKTYRNEEYGFEIEYSDRFVESDKKDCFELGPDDQYRQSEFCIFVHGNQKQLTISEWLTESGNIKFYGGILEEDLLSIPNTEVIYMNYGPPTVVYLFKHGDRIFGISGMNYSIDNIKSFKFINDGNH